MAKTATAPTAKTSVLIRDVTAQARRITEQGIDKESDRFRDAMAEWVLSKIDWNSFTTRPERW